MKTILMLQTLFVASAACVFAIPQIANAQQQSWDTSFVAKDTFFHAGLNVESLLALEPEDSDLRKTMVESIEREMGVVVADLKQVQFIMGGSTEGNVENVFQAKMTYKKEQDFTRLIKQMLRDRFKEAEHDGKTFLKNDNDRSPSLYMPDPQTAVVANSPRMPSLIESKTGKGEIADVLSKADGSANAFIVFKYTPELDKIVAELAEEIPGLPFDLHDIASEAENGQITLKLDSDTPFVATIKAKDAGGAERLKRAIDALIGLGKFGVPQARAQLDKIPDDEEAQKMKKEALKGLDTAEALLDGATVETNGATLEIKTRVMGGATEGIRALLRSMFFGMSVRTERAVDAAEIRVLEE